MKGDIPLASPTYAVQPFSLVDLKTNLQTRSEQANLKGNSREAINLLKYYQNDEITTRKSRLSRKL